MFAQLGWEITKRIQLKKKQQKPGKVNTSSPGNNSNLRFGCSKRRRFSTSETVCVGIMRSFRDGLKELLPITPNAPSTP